MSLLNGKNPNIQAAVCASGIYYGKDSVIITFPREFVAGDQWGITADGTLTTTTFATTSDAMLDAILTDFVAITGTIGGGKVLNYNDKPRIVVNGNKTGREIIFTLPTGTTDLQNSTTIVHSGVEEYGLVITNPFDILAAKIVDSNTAGTVYTGYALTGSVTTAPSWAIKRAVTAVNVETTTWADGNTNPDNIWDNRAALSYS